MQQHWHGSTFPPPFQHLVAVPESSAFQLRRSMQLSLAAGSSPTLKGHGRFGYDAAAMFGDFWFQELALMGIQAGTSALFIGAHNRL